MREVAARIQRVEFNPPVEHVARVISPRTNEIFSRPLPGRYRSLLEIRLIGFEARLDIFGTKQR
jgi:hypothetical protein